jgi:hypothetical protein
MGESSQSDPVRYTRRRVLATTVGIGAAAVLGGGGPAAASSSSSATLHVDLIGKPLCGRHGHGAASAHDSRWDRQAKPSGCPDPVIFCLHETLGLVARVVCYPAADRSVTSAQRPPAGTHRCQRPERVPTCGGRVLAHGRRSAGAFVVAACFFAVAADSHRAPAGAVGAAAVEQEQLALVVGAGA